VRDIEVESCGAASLPIILELAIEMAPADGDENAGAKDGPEHAGLLEPGCDYGFASGFDDAGADSQVPAAELGVVHAFAISLQVGGFDAQLLDDFGIGGCDGTEAGVHFFDFPLVQQAPVPRRPGTGHGFRRWCFLS